MACLTNCMLPMTSNTLSAFCLSLAVVNNKVILGAISSMDKTYLECSLSSALASSVLLFPVLCAKQPLLKRSLVFPKQTVIILPPKRRDRQCLRINKRPRKRKVQRCLPLTVRQDEDAISASCKIVFL